MGKPYGSTVVEPAHTSICYKIVPDPYFRRFSIEKYIQGHFDRIIYDSFLLDFRHLKTIEQLAWHKENLEENKDTSKSLLRDPDDRAVLIETYYFENNRCRSCNIHSIHGLHLATNRMYYKTFGDTYNGVVLYDIENRAIMKKIYELDEISGEFSTLLSEEWDMQNERRYGHPLLS